MPAPTYLEPVRGSHKYGCVRINAGNSYEHELAKFNMAWALAKKKHPFITEAEFLDGSGRADLIDLKENRAFEFAKSENEKSLASKARKYPIPFAIVRIRKSKIEQILDNRRAAVNASIKESTCVASRRNWHNDQTQNPERCNAFVFSI